MEATPAVQILRLAVVFTIVLKVTRSYGAGGLNMIHGI